MRVKVGSQWFRPEPGQPIMVELNAGERKQVSQMHKDATRYAQFCDDDALTDEAMFAWMDQENLDD